MQPFYILLTTVPGKICALRDNVVFLEGRVIQASRRSRTNRGRPQTSRPSKGRLYNVLAGSRSEAQPPGARMAVRKKTLTRRATAVKPRSILCNSSTTATTTHRGVMCSGGSSDPCFTPLQRRRPARIRPNPSGLGRPVPWDRIDLGRVSGTLKFGLEGVTDRATTAHCTAARKGIPVSKKQYSIIDALREKGRRMLDEAKAESYGGDLLDLIPSGETVGKSRDSGWTNLGRQPKMEEIDPITSEEMILENTAILRGGRKIYWVSS
jgi:hypothetical protein